MLASIEGFIRVAQKRRLFGWRVYAVTW
jgi:hypothetical protein